MIEQFTQAMAASPTGIVIMGHPGEAAFEAGYKTRPRQAASELRNPKYSPLVVKYIGEIREEIHEFSSLYYFFPQVLSWSH